MWLRDPKFRDGSNVGSQSSSSQDIIPRVKVFAIRGKETSVVRVGDISGGARVRV